MPEIRVLGLTISDENLERGICFLSAAPDAEHHELALVQAKEPGQKTHNVQQVSFKVKTLDDVRSFYHRLKQEGLKIDRTVTHGIACSVYFFDPGTTGSSSTTRRRTRCASRSASTSTWTSPTPSSWPSRARSRRSRGRRAGPSSPWRDPLPRTPGAK